MSERSENLTMIEERPLTEEQVVFQSPLERSVAGGLAEYHDGRPVGERVVSGGEPNAKIILTKYPARG